MRPCLLVTVLAVAWLSSTRAEFALGPLVPLDPPPVSNWLLTPGTLVPNGIPSSARQAWRKIDAKVWTLLTNLDHEFTDASGTPVPPRLAFQRVFPAQCGRLARQLVSGQHICSDAHVTSTSHLEVGTQGVSICTSCVASSVTTALQLACISLVTVAVVVCMDIASTTRRWLAHHLSACVCCLIWLHNPPLDVSRFFRPFTAARQRQIRMPFHE